MTEHRCRWVLAGRGQTIVQLLKIIINRNRYMPWPGPSEARTIHNASPPSVAQKHLQRSHPQSLAAAATDQHNGRCGAGTFAPDVQLQTVQVDQLSRRGIRVPGL